MTERVLRLRADAVHFREIEGEIVAVDVAGGEYLAVNRSGAVLWSALVEGATLPALAAHLEDRFRIDPARARADAATFVDALDARGILEP